MPYACRITISKVINSYTENAGVAGQNNKQVAAYADLGEAGERLSLHARDRNVQGVECAFLEVGSNLFGHLTNAN